jgi:bifunctional DNA-binding transcriptional regulator/antitoxin component of YhaV-PrlF toxin-antitoxin module
MLAQTVKVDPDGRVTLPKPLLEASGITPEAEVVIELTETGLVIKPKWPHAPITARIALMDLPVAEWEEMERAIEEARTER